MEPKPLTISVDSDGDLCIEAPTVEQYLFRCGDVHAYKLTATPDAALTLHVMYAPDADHITPYECPIDIRLFSLIAPRGLQDQLMKPVSDFLKMHAIH